MLHRTATSVFSVNFTVVVAVPPPTRAALNEILKKGLESSESECRRTLSGLDLLRLVDDRWGWGW